MTGLQPNSISDSETRKQLLWYLPAGAGGMTAGYKSMALRKHYREWAELYKINVKQIEIGTFVNYGESQKRYFRLIMPENIAIMFMLTWQKEQPLKIMDYPQ